MTVNGHSYVNRQAILNVPGEAYEIIDGTIPDVGPTQALVNLTHSGCCYTYVTSSLTVTHSHIDYDSDTHARFAPCSCFG